MLFWFNYYLNSLALQHFWLAIFQNHQNQFSTVKAIVLTFLLLITSMDYFLSKTITRILDLARDKDIKSCILAPNGRFSVKSFYGFLNDDGHCCPISPLIWKGPCSCKINIFYQLVQDNKILILENLTTQKRNILLLQHAFLVMQ